MFWIIVLSLLAVNYLGATLLASGREPAVRIPYNPAFLKQWWDPNGRPIGSGAQPGCWRMTHEGKRSLIGQWIGGDDVFRHPDDPCNGFEGGRRIK